MTTTYVANDNEEVKTILDDLRKIKDHLSEVKDHEQYLIQKLYNHVNEHDRIVLVDEDGIEKVLATWKYNKDSKHFNSKKFKEENSSLYEKYCELKPGSRTFRLKD